MCRMRQSWMRRMRQSWMRRMRQIQQGQGWMHLMRQIQQDQSWTHLMRQTGHRSDRLQQAREASLQNQTEILLPP